MKIYNLLTQDMILLDMEADSRDAVLKEMVGFLKKRERITKGKDLFEKLIKREELGSTAIGEGVAIPHCKLKSIKNPIVLLAVSRRGVDFLALDGKPSHLFFLVVSSPENPSLNLQILAAIAHLVRKAKPLLNRVLKAQSAGMILEVVRDEEDKINE